jgi:putative transposase
MPWNECDRATARWNFVQAVLAQRASFAAVCRQHGISRECGHKWWRRFRQGGRPALHERTRQPQRAARQQCRWQRRLLALRRRQPTWGPHKLHWLLRQQHPRARVPAVRTLGRWLTAAGLVRRRVRRSPPGPQVPSPAPPTATRPNDLWTLDFKGAFRTADGTRLLPLTVRDAASRCVLAVRHLRHPSDRAVRRVLTGLFRRLGLPRAVQVDNGAPFAGCGARGLSTLSVWWLRLGLQVVFTRPGCPQDNGAHEQMHRVLKAETARPPAANARTQQRRFTRWCRHYNEQRPHAALGQRTPASCYRPSPRPLPAALPVWSYPPDWLRVRPSTRGQVWWEQRQRMFGRAFAGEWLGVRLRRGGWAEVYLGPHLLGRLHRDDRAGLRAARTRPLKRR